MRRRAWDAPTMDMHQYSVPKIVLFFEEAGIADIVIVPA
jgi:hypothetical protein